MQKISEDCLSMDQNYQNYFSMCDYISERDVLPSTRFLFTASCDKPSNSLGLFQCTSLIAGASYKKHSDFLNVTMVISFLHYEYLSDIKIGMPRAQFKVTCNVLSHVV